MEGDIPSIIIKVQVKSIFLEKFLNVHLGHGWGGVMLIMMFGIAVGRVEQPLNQLVPVRSV